MNELVQMVQQKTGLSQDMAQKVVDTVVGYLKTKLPAPLSSGLDELMGAGAGSDASGDAAGATDEAGGLMGKAQSMVADMFKKQGA
jgi:hypothetical protein